MFLRTAGVYAARVVQRALCRGACQHRLGLRQKPYGKVGRRFRPVPVTARGVAHREPDRGLPQGASTCAWLSPRGPGGAACPWSKAPRACGVRRWLRVPLDSTFEDADERVFIDPS